MGVPRVKKPKSNKEYQEGRKNATADCLVLICALLMQDYNFTIQDIKDFGSKILKWQEYTKEPQLPFYISTVEQILKEQGIKIIR